MKKKETKIIGSRWHQIGSLKKAMKGHRKTQAKNHAIPWHLTPTHYMSMDFLLLSCEAIEMPIILTARCKRSTTPHRCPQLHGDLCRSSEFSRVLPPFACKNILRQVPDCFTRLLDASREPKRAKPTCDVPALDKTRTIFWPMFSDGVSLAQNCLK